MSTNNGKTFVLDTNILINFAIWHPFKFSQDFWQKIDRFLEEGKWVLLDVVAEEAKYPDDLAEWVKKQKAAGLVIKIDDNIRNRAVEINDTYPITDWAKSKADPYIIAFAEANKHIVFTREKFRENSNNPYKIPDVCRILRIQCIKYPEKFMRAIGF